jgi:hypothetical protein
MKFFLDIKRVLTIGKIISFSLLIFFWDLKVNNIDFRLVVFFLLFITFIDSSFSSLKKNFKSFYFVLLLLLFITLHFYLNLIFDNQSIIFFPKDLFYILVTLFVIFINLIFIRKNLDHIIFFFIFCFIIFTIINFLWTDYNILLSIYDRGLLLSCSYHGGWHGYTRFFFSENSHLAMMSVPVLLYYFLGFSLNKLNFVKKFFFFSFFLFSIINYTLTFLVGIILCILLVSFTNIKYFIQKKVYIKTIFLICLSLFFLISDPECKNKLYNSSSAITNANKNLDLSSAVFINSIHIAKTTITDRPLGWGLNRYEAAYSNYAINNKVTYNLDELHHKLFVWNLNMKDASSNFSKLITEFGIFSFIIFLYFIFFSFSNKANLQEKLFLNSIIIIQFLRGAGYFNGGFLFCVLLMFFISLPRKDV